MKKEKFKFELYELSLVIIYILACTVFGAIVGIIVGLLLG